MFLYVLALGSPTHSVAPEAWDAFTSTYTWGDFYGYEHVNFGPLFGHQYSHVWIDFRGIQDAYMRERGLDYFENSRLATLSQRAYAIDNPSGFVGYGEDVWGRGSGSTHPGWPRATRGSVPAPSSGTRRPPRPGSPSSTRSAIPAARVAEWRQSGTVPPGRSETVEVWSEPIPDPQLYTPETPAVYHVHSELAVDGEVRDRVVEPLGFRWVERQDQIDALIPPYGAVPRRLGRWLRDLL